MARDARKRKVLEKPAQKTGHPLPDATKTDVAAFYHDDRHSRVLAGQNDHIKNVQKRLLLFSVKELYGMYREASPHVKIGMTKFYELRPKHCVFPGASGNTNIITSSGFFYKL